jgi:hypothetical protein
MTMNNKAIKNNSTYPHFFVAENTMSLFEYTHNPQETQALPLCEISGIDFRFSGHLAPGLLVRAFMSDCPIAKFCARYARRIPSLTFNSIPISLFSLSVE